MTKEKLRTRSRFGGILLHPTSLPSSDGIGDLGQHALKWIDWLAEAGCGLWQVLPLGPTGYGDSPYQCFSAMAGNHLLISLERLREEGLLYSSDFQSRPHFPSERVEYGAVIEYKDHMLGLAWERFSLGMGQHLDEDYRIFCRHESFWLDDFALFMTLKLVHSGQVWTSWEPELRTRLPEALEKAAAAYSDRIENQKFRQFLFFRQWGEVRKYANEKAIQVIGDIPIFVAHDSADVWSHPEYFSLQPNGSPAFVAGVPPDYFSATGQLWGNPLYSWKRMRADGYSWWIQRLESVLKMVDLVRLDHFRGFEAYWEIPASALTAEIGRWVTGPGTDFFLAVRQAFTELPLIAEDLGVITPEVVALREAFNLPGMKVLHFAFEGEADNEFLPHHYPHRCIVYTGTHDNDTSLGWYQTTSEAARDFCRRYLTADDRNIVWDLIRAAWTSVAEKALAPMQDFLELGSEARMNYPSRAEGNWVWRVREDQLHASLAERIHEMNFLYGRLAHDPSKEQAD